MKRCHTAITSADALECNAHPNRQHSEQRIDHIKADTSNCTCMSA
jgi:hypothetical protein